MLDLGVKKPHSCFMIKRFNRIKTTENNKYLQPETGRIWYKTQTRVLYADTDAAQVVYHANYLKYFEIARAELLRDYGISYKTIEENNIFHPIVNLEMTFHAPARYDDLIDIYVTPFSMEVVKFALEYKIFHSQTDQFLVKGNTVHCCILGKQVAPVDEMTKGLFLSYLDKMK